MKNITVGELRKALEGVPDELEVCLDSDTGIDQGEGIVIIEKAERISYSNSFGNVDYFRIYANDVELPRYAPRDDDEENYSNKLDVCPWCMDAVVARSKRKRLISKLLGKRNEI